MLVYKDYTEGNIDAYPMYTYHICEGEVKIGKLFLILKSSYELRVDIALPRLLDDWVDVKERHVKEIINLVENHMIIDEPYSKIEYDIDHLDMPL